MIVCYLWFIILKKELPVVLGLIFKYSISNTLPVLTSIVNPICCHIKCLKSLCQCLNTLKIKTSVWEKFPVLDLISKILHVLMPCCSMQHAMLTPINTCIYCQRGPIFCLLLRVSSGYARPIAGQVTSVTWPVIGWAYSQQEAEKTRPCCVYISLFVSDVWLHLG